VIRAPNSTQLNQLLESRPKLQQSPTSTTALQEAAKVAEATATPTINEEMLDAIRRLEMRSFDNPDVPPAAQSFSVAGGYNRSQADGSSALC